MAAYRDSAEGWHGSDGLQRGWHLDREVCADLSVWLQSREPLVQSDAESRSFAKSKVVQTDPLDALASPAIDAAMEKQP